MASSWALIVHDGLILLTRRSERTSRPGQWCLPGGGIHSGETPEAACVREVREEVGLPVVVVRDLLTEDQQHFFLCSALATEPVIIKPNEVQGYAWSAPDRIRELGVIMDFRRIQRVLRSASLLPAR